MHPLATVHAHKVLPTQDMSQCQSPIYKRMLCRSARCAVCEKPRARQMRVATRRAVQQCACGSPGCLALHLGNCQGMGAFAAGSCEALFPLLGCAAHHAWRAALASAWAALAMRMYNSACLQDARSHALRSHAVMLLWPHATSAWCMAACAPNSIEAAPGWGHIIARFGEPGG